MEQKQLFLPESMYNVDSKMTLEKLKVFQENGTPITGKVLRLNTKDSQLEVKIGKGFIGIIPYEDSTIYPIFTHDGYLSPNIYSLVGKRIQARVISVEGDKILLSRKENMLAALDEILKVQSNIEFAAVTGFSRFSVFMDIGAGITGRSYSKFFAPVLYRHTKDIGIKEGQIVPIEILGFNEDTKNFDLSRVLPSFENYLNLGDFITCKVFGEVENDPTASGYYVLIDDCISGILDCKNEILNYGDMVTGIVKKMGTKGPKLNFVRRL